MKDTIIGLQEEERDGGSGCEGGTLKRREAAVLRFRWLRLSLLPAH